MLDDATRSRARTSRAAARGRARRYEHTEAQEAFERSGDSARRLIQSEELLTASELTRARLQLEIAREDRQDEAWHKAELAQYRSEAWVQNARARVALVTRVVISIAAVGLVAYSVASGLSPTEVWHLLTSMR